MNTPSPPRTAREPPTLAISQLEQDPHGVFRHYRPLTPLLRREDGTYIAIRAADIEPLAFDPRTRQLQTELHALRGIRSGPLFDFLDNTMLLANGAEHRRRRAPMSRAFSFKFIEALRLRIRATAAGIIAAHYERGRMNFLDEFAALIPARIISEILGMSPADIPQFTGWVYRVSRALSYSYGPDDAADIQEAAGHLQRYVSELLSVRQSDPRDDFLTTYIRSASEDGTLSALEILTQVVTVIIAGSDTTRGALSIMVCLLLQHREQWQAVCDDPALIPGAVSEALRYEPIVATIPRFTLEDIEIDGYRVPRNSILTLSTLSAMRDPSLYGEPDTFNIRRTDHPRKHLIFGLGVHRCLGEMLARAELEESLAALVSRLPDLQLVGIAPVPAGHTGIRRISGMEVGW